MVTEIMKPSFSVIQITGVVDLSHTTPQQILTLSHPQALGSPRAQRNKMRYPVLYKPTPSLKDIYIYNMI